MEPTRLMVRAIMSPRRAAHFERWADRTWSTHRHPVQWRAIVPFRWLPSLEDTRMKRYVAALLVSLFPAVAVAQANASAQAARAWRQQHEHSIVDEFITLLTVPNISRDRENILRNAALIVRMLEKRGIAAKLVSAPVGNPIVFGEIRTPGAT
jgi:hypothetical protein